LIPLAGIAVVIAVLRAAGGVANATTVALVLLLWVVISSTRYGPRVGAVAAIVAVLAFNFFFLPPLHTFALQDPLNWIALCAFLVVALVTGELSDRVRRRAEEAETSQREIDRLYKELKAAFDRAAQAEALRRSDQLKSALLDAVTHDLRTPLTSIKASTTALLDATSTLGGAARRELLEVVNEETDRLDRIIGALVSLAKVEAGALGLQPRWCALDDVLQSAIARVRHDSGRIVTAVDAQLPSIRADGRALEEVFTQLLQNALRYSPLGSPVTVRATCANGAVDVRVEDEGPGIAAADRERIFEKFHRGDRETGGWLGLGLAIARGIVDAHGGTITATDRADGRHGAAFVVRVPIGDQVSAHPAPGAAG
jgi:K+-sensing histidine kinase KdpD